jgi:catecholate siderophore receptor
VDAGVTRSDAPESVTVHRMIFSGQSEERMLQGQLNLRADFETGNFSHALVSGVELSSETSDPSFGFASQTPFFDYGILVPTTNLANPGGAWSGLTARRLQSDSSSDTLAAYVLDTLKFNDQWHLSLGMRWDRFETDYVETRYDVDEIETGNARYLTRDIEASYRTALVYKPVPEGTLYLGWGTSFNPSAEGLSFISSGRGLNTSNVSLEPEENESVELGTKWSLFNDRLLIDAAVFRITKENARVSDPLNPGFNTLAGEQDIRGFSVSMSGGFGDVLHFTSGYTRLDDEQLNSLTGATGRIDNVAENAFSFWLDLAMGDTMDFGVGTRYLDERVVANSKRVDDYWAFDALVRYQYSDNITYKLNLTNLADETYFDQLHPWHVIPGHGFAAVFAVNLDF